MNCANFKMISFCCQKCRKNQKTFGSWFRKKNYRFNVAALKLFSMFGSRPTYICEYAFLSMKIEKPKQTREIGFTKLPTHGHYWHFCGPKYVCARCIAITNFPLIHNKPWQLQLFCLLIFGIRIGPRNKLTYFFGTR